MTVSGYEMLNTCSHLVPFLLRGVQVQFYKPVFYAIQAKLVKFAINFILHVHSTAIATIVL
jgi:hypothetical protein